MLYGSYAWTTATEENVKRVFKLQKQAARVILDANIRDRRTERPFRRLDWLPFKDEVNLQKCSLIFRRIRNEDDCPDDLMKLFPRNSDLRSDIRASVIWYVHLVTGNRRGRTFKARGAKLWNGIPLDMRKIATSGSFKNVLKKYIFFPTSYVYNVFIFLNSNVHITFSYLSSFYIRNLRLRATSSSVFLSSV